MWQALSLSLRPADAIDVCQFGDLGIQEEDWPILGRLPSWPSERDLWAPPPFGGVSLSDPSRGYLRYYDPEDISELYIREEECSVEKAKAHWEDGSLGHAAVQRGLMRVLLARDNHERLIPFRME